MTKSTTPTNCIFSEPRCGPIGASISLSPCDIDVPQPIIDRRPSMSLFKWGGSQKRNDAPTPTAARQGLNLINQPPNSFSIFIDSNHSLELFTFHIFIIFELNSHQKCSS